MATPRDFLKSIAYAARDRMFDRWNRTQQRYHREDVRRIYYLSLEYLTGRLLSDSLANLGISDEARAALRISTSSSTISFRSRRPWAR